MPAKNKGIALAAKDRRRHEAGVRQAAFDTLTTQEKLRQLPTGAANKQRAKLEAQLRTDA